VEERVQAYTHPLWMFLFSAVYAVTREPYYTGILLGAAVTMAALVLFVWKVVRSPISAALAILALCFSVAFVDLSTSGLENPLTHLILVLFLWVFFTGVNGTRRMPGVDQPHAKRAEDKTRVWLLSLLASLAAVNRMDTILLFAPALAYTLWRQRSWRCVWSMAIETTPLVGWLAFSTFYYGFPFPNTAYSKLGTGISSAVYAAGGRFGGILARGHSPPPATLRIPPGLPLVAAEAR
jgi:arabinofuranosyltransferase